ncbi:hypothetical protein [Fusibacter ferrireducens]|uniref:Uncharacterized protein n=1 Tax=Fusibacter ferrireducens TaxID=2785058 RepID=A0ABR9ZM57_9FIRM|nr:hypothetical protein [Fusibacter ferrireducens]MBF4691514.1 hypothetical protein [Fusibacter ferrireducens]
MRKITTLCGSTRFKESFENIEKKLTLEGRIVLSVCFFDKDDVLELDSEQYEILGELHRDKIKMSDGIFVINENGYIGESTRREIEYAQLLNKEIEYLES